MHAWCAKDARLVCERYASADVSEEKKGVWMRGDAAGPPRPFPGDAGLFRAPHLPHSTGNQSAHRLGYTAKAENRKAASDRGGKNRRQIPLRRVVPPYRAFPPPPACAATPIVGTTTSATGCTVKNAIRGRSYKGHHVHRGMVGGVPRVSWTGPSSSRA